MKWQSLWELDSTYLMKTQLTYNKEQFSNFPEGICSLALQMSIKTLFQIGSVGQF